MYHFWRLSLLIPDKKSISELFQPREQYLIPLFQRGYVWTLEKQISLLWQDIIEQCDALEQHRANAKAVGAEKLRKLRKHFMGAIVLGPLDEGDGDTIRTREVIDGQQRLTTLQILLLAFRDLAQAIDDAGLNRDLHDLTANHGDYPRKSDRQKVFPTNAGRDVMQSLFELGSLDAVCARYPAWQKVSDADKKTEFVERPPMVQAYLYFHAMLLSELRGFRFDAQVSGNENDDGRTVSDDIIRQISRANTFKLPGADIAIDRDKAKLLLSSFHQCFQVMQLRLDQEDDPQIIFETLNARGEPLTPSDLIRNFLFLRSVRAGESVDELYEDYWKPFDEKADVSGAAKGAKFWKKEERQGRLKSARLDLFMYHFTTLRRVSTLKVAHVFEEFKDWWDEEERDTRTELGRIRGLSGRFESFLVPGQKTRFDRFCRRLKLLDTSTPTPLLLYFLEHFDPASEEFQQVMADLDSYLVRRFVSGLSTKSYNKTFLNLLADQVGAGTPCPQRLRNSLLALEGDSQLWPSDQLFADKWVHERLYSGSSTRRVKAVLEGLEVALRSSKQEFLPEFDVLSVEHILPQKWKPTDYPLSEEDPEARVKRDRLIHSMGNLTLVTPGYNATLSNRSFAEKRPEITANSSLLLNGYFQKFDQDGVWDEGQIEDRARHLLPVALGLWKLPIAT
jgi:uncharacterized protein with ParB-like and HNH nuclease domain